MARESKTRYAVLGLLSTEPMSGYDMKKRFEEYLGKFWSESYGQIYPITRELVEEGLATSTVERTDGRPDRHVFTITEKGLAELRWWLDRPTDPHKERLEVLLKLICGAHMPVSRSVELVQAFRAEWLAHMASYAEIENELREVHEGSPQWPYWKMAVSCGMHIGNAYVAWCDETVEKLRTMEMESMETDVAVRGEE